MKVILTLLGSLFLAACVQAQIQSPGPASEKEADPERPLPRLESGRILADDGYELPMTRWMPSGDVERVVLALHGFNDFRASHQSVAWTLSRTGTAVYAYDQRGFGSTDQRGIWPGGDRLVKDAQDAIELLKGRYGDTPLYLLGESMGAAVAILALKGESAEQVSGTILMAPAVWGRDIQPWYQRMGLWLGIRLTPGMLLDSEWVDVEPTDDPDWTNYWEQHPLVIHRSRVDALDGLSELMGQALKASAELPGPTLILYGGNDEVIPDDAICNMIQRLPEDWDARSIHLAYYPDGWHFLGRDRRANETLMDIDYWHQQQALPLPSGRALERAAALRLLCG